MGVCVSRHLNGELAYYTDKQVCVISILLTTEKLKNKAVSMSAKYKHMYIYSISIKSVT